MNPASYLLELINLGIGIESTVASIQSDSTNKWLDIQDKYELQLKLIHQRIFLFNNQNTHNILYNAQYNLAAYLAIKDCNDLSADKYG